MGDLVVILYDVRSVHNVGSVFRTADAAGVSKVYLTGVTPGPLDRFDGYRKDFLKVALGAERTVEWEKVKSTSVLITRLKKEGFLVVAVEQDKRSIPYYQWNSIRQTQGKKQGIALIFGEETKGLSKSVLGKCDKILEIPMKGATIRQAHHPKNRKTPKRGKESLNVSVAAGIVLFNLLYS